MIHYTCTCGKAYSLDEAMAGRKVKCKKCQQINTVPEPATSAKGGGRTSLFGIIGCVAAIAVLVLHFTHDPHNVNRLRKQVEQMTEQGAGDTLATLRLDLQAIDRELKQWRITELRAQVAQLAALTAEHSASGTPNDTATRFEALTEELATLQRVVAEMNADPAGAPSTDANRPTVHEVIAEPTGVVNNKPGWPVSDAELIRFLDTTLVTDYNIADITTLDAIYPTLLDLLRHLKSQDGVSAQADRIIFSIEPNLKNSKRFSMPFYYFYLVGTVTMEQVLHHILDQAGLDYRVNNRRIVISVSTKENRTDPPGFNDLLNTQLETKRLSGNWEFDGMIEDALRALSEHYQIPIVISQNVFTGEAEGRHVTITLLKGMSFHRVLTTLLKPTGLHYTVDHRAVMVQPTAPQSP